jgi:hypothetical protein
VAEPEPRPRRAAARPARRASADGRPRRQEQDAPPRRRVEAEDEDGHRREEDAPTEPVRRKTPDRAPDDAAPRRTRLGAAKAAATAADHVRVLTGRSPQGVTALERTSEGWRVGIEVLESRRIPDSTDILAVYEVVLDEDGELVSYRRESRYYRGRAQREEPS